MMGGGRFANENGYYSYAANRYVARSSSAANKLLLLCCPHINININSNSNINKISLRPFSIPAFLMGVSLLRRVGQPSANLAISHRHGVQIPL